MQLSDIETHFFNNTIYPIERKDAHNSMQVTKKGKCEKFYEKCIVTPDAIM